MAPIGRLDAEKITKHFCNTCEKEFEGSPKIEFENPNEEVAENLILAERGQYVCNSCNSALAEYREFKKQDEATEVGKAKPIEPTVESNTTSMSQQTADIAPQTTTPETVTQPDSKGSVTSIEGRSVFDENANKIGVAKQVGIDSTQAMVLVITKNDGTEGSIPWKKIKKIGEIILLGNPDVIQQQVGQCSSCGFENKEGSKFCEECGTKL